MRSGLFLSRTPLHPQEREGVQPSQRLGASQQLFSHPPDLPFSKKIPALLPAEVKREKLNLGNNPDHEFCCFIFCCLVSTPESKIDRAGCAFFRKHQSLAFTVFLSRSNFQDQACLLLVKLFIVVTKINLFTFLLHFEKMRSTREWRKNVIFAPQAPIFRAFFAWNP